MSFYVSFSWDFNFIHIFWKLLRPLHVKMEFKSPSVHIWFPLLKWQWSQYWQMDVSWSHSTSLFCIFDLHCLLMVKGQQSEEVQYPTIKINREQIICVLLITVDMTSNLSDFLKVWSKVYLEFLATLQM